MEAYIQFKGVTKQFGGITALKDVSFDIRKGEVHCLCGENGAGKSTLINICGGVFMPTRGEIWIDGKPEKINSIQKSESLGFAVVHQEVPLCKNMSIAHNIFLGSAKAVKGVLINEKFMRAETQKLLDQFHLKLDPAQLVETLSIAEQSIIQIAKAIYFEPKILILDEPTASLTNDQREIMFENVRRLIRTKQTTVIYVSHRLEEVMELGDRLTVFRDGQFITTRDVADTSMDDIVSLMVGRKIERVNWDRSCVSDEELLRVEGFSKKRQFEDINFSLRKGEILGFGGFVGAGRTEMISSIFGINPADSGKLYLHGKEVKVCSAADAIRNRIALIPESRRDDALIAEMSIQQNAQLVVLRNLVKGGLVNRRRANTLMDNMIKQYAIKCGNPSDPIMTLSGGNQQKVVIARWIASQPEVLLCDEPTRGIDVGAKAEVYEILREISSRGIGIILVSSELPELISLCDRIIVMHEGKITGELTREDANEESIMRYAAAVN